MSYDAHQQGAEVNSCCCRCDLENSIDRVSTWVLNILGRSNAAEAKKPNPEENVHVVVPLISMED